MNAIRPSLKIGSVQNLSFFFVGHHNTQWLMVMTLKDFFYIYIPLFSLHSVRVRSFVTRANHIFSSPEVCRKYELRGLAMRKQSSQLDE